MKSLEVLAGIGIATIACIVAKSVVSVYDILYGPIKCKSYIRFKESK